MSGQTSSSGSCLSAFFHGKKIPTAEDIYDYLMQEIEPDLVTSNAQSLEEKYADESAEEQEQRFLRYRKAFAEYKQKKADFFVQMETKVKHFCQERFEKLEAASRSHDDEKVAALEKLLLTVA